MSECTHPNKVYATRSKDLYFPIGQQSWICPDCGFNDSDPVDPADYTPYETLMMSKYCPPIATTRPTEI